jgi:hypothetical protein
MFVLGFWDRHEITFWAENQMCKGKRGALLGFLIIL